VPILFLTARDDEIDKLTGFGVGGDDYITKPASLLELEARLRVALRRGRQSTSDEETPGFEWDGIVADFDSHEVDVRGERVRLSAKEAALLRFLVENRGKALSRDVLLERVWGYAEGVSSRTVDTHVRTLRSKIRDAEGRCRYIETVHGVGYKFTG
jgi:two-component system alkaline phosphatase synthesis response regulator PhoP